MSSIWHNPQNDTVFCGSRRRSAFYLILVIFFIIAFFPVPLCADQSSNLTANGINLLNQGHYNEAIRAFDSALALNPDNIQARVNKGTALFSAGRPSESLLSLDIALGKDPSNLPALLEQGRIMLATGNFEGALSSFNQVLVLNPADVTALEGKGDALSGLGRGTDAINAWKRGLSDDPGNTVLQAKIAVGEKNSGFSESLVWTIIIAILLLSSCAGGFFVLRATRRGSPPGTKKNKKFHEMLTRPRNEITKERPRVPQTPNLPGRAPDVVPAVKKFSYISGLKNRLNISDSRAGRPDRTVSDPEFLAGRSVAGGSPGLKPGIPGAPATDFQEIAEVDVSCSRSSTGGTSGIVTGLNSLLKTGESKYNGAGLRGILLYSSGEYEGAIKEFNKEIAADPKSIGIALLNVRALIHLGRLQEALDLDRAIIKQKKNDYEAIVIAASLSEQLGYLDFGLKACNAATRLRRNAADVWEVRGKILYKMGNYSEALSTFRQSLDLDGGVGAVWKEYGLVLATSGWYQEAIEAYGKVVLLDGETPELRACIEKCLKNFKENQNPAEVNTFRQSVTDNEQIDPEKRIPHSGTGKDFCEEQASLNPDNRDMILVHDASHRNDLLNASTYGQKF